MNRLIDIYLKVKVHLRNAVTNYVIPDAKFLSHDMTNVVRGNLERRNLLSSFPSFWMPDFSDPSQEERKSHI
jgi:hypothetical protein